MAVTHKWCLDETILPLERRILDLCSWTGGRAETTKEDCPFLLLRLGGRAGAPWLGKHFRQPAKWWWSLSRRANIIKDMLEQYPTKLNGRSRNVVVPIVVRGQEILVLNERRAVVLAFEEAGAQFESLQWFIDE